MGDVAGAEEGRVGDEVALVLGYVVDVHIRHEGLYTAENVAGVVCETVVFGLVS